MTPDPIVLSAGLNQNCQLFRGEDKLISIDMTGYDLATATALEWWMAKSAWATDDPLEVFIKKSLATGIAINESKAEITIAATDTAAIKPEVYYHELKITQGDGSIKVAMTGHVVLRMALNMEEATP